MEDVVMNSPKLGTNIEMDSTAQVNSEELANTNNPKKRNMRQRSGGIYYGIFDMSSDDDLEFISIKKVFFFLPTAFTYFYKLI
jgi:hypothetical protein